MLMRGLRLVRLREDPVYTVQVVSASEHSHVGLGMRMNTHPNTTHDIQPNKDIEDQRSEAD